MLECEYDELSALGYARLSLQQRDRLDEILLELNEIFNRRGWGELLGVLVGMDQMECGICRACRRLRRGWCLVCAGWFCRYCASRYVSLLLSSGFRCSALWPVCTRRLLRGERLRSSSTPALACAWLILLVFGILRDSGRAHHRSRQWHGKWLVLQVVLSRCVPFCCLQAQDARHHGRYGTEGLFASIVFALVVVLGTGMCMAGFAGNDASHAVAGMTVVCSDGCSLAQYAETADFPKIRLINKVIKIPVVAQRLLHVVQPVLRTIKILQLLVDTVIDVPVFAGGASSTDAVVEKTVVLPRLHSLRNSLRSQTEFGHCLGQLIIAVMS